MDDGWMDDVWWVLMLLMMMLMIVCLIERLLDCFLIGSWID